MSNDATQTKMMTGWPRLGAYLAGLPNGLDSHPQCQAKGSQFSFVLRCSPVQKLRGLPPPLQALVDDVPLATSWVPEVHYMALCMAIVDLGELDVDACARWWGVLVNSMASSRVYGALLAMLTPGLVVRGSAQRWDRLHRGSRLRATANDDALELHLEFPEGLFDRFMCEAFTGGFTAIVRRSRVPTSSLRLVHWSPCSARWRLDLS